MTINTRINSYQAYSEYKYPILMRDVRSDLIVLFKNETSGTIICPGHRYKVGEFWDNLISARNTAEWEIFRGEICLDNA